MHYKKKDDGRRKGRNFRTRDINEGPVGDWSRRNSASRRDHKKAMAVEEEFVPQAEWGDITYHIQHQIVWPKS